MDVPHATSKNSDTDSELMLGLLRAVHDNDALTQRSAAEELGCALGLVNSYLKRCVNKGFVKIKQAPSSRYIYYLTPKGFVEKSRLTAQFVTQSLSLFRQAQQEYQEILDHCSANGLRRVALCGVSDLAEIIAVYARTYPVEIVGIIDPRHGGGTACHLRVFDGLDALNVTPDACIITDLRHAQATYNALAKIFPAARVLSPRLLELKTKTPGGEGGS